MLSFTLLATEIDFSANDFHVIDKKRSILWSTAFKSGTMVDDEASRSMMLSWWGRL